MKQINTDILIVGGGVSGLVANWAFKKRRPGLNVKVLEPGLPGGEFTSGGLKYIHKTDAMVEMFEALELPYSTYAVRGGILLRNEVRPYPQCFAELGEDESKRIQQDHYAKTRRTSPDRFAAKAMNDPAATGPRRALRCNFDDMVDALAMEASIITKAAKVLATDRNTVVLDDHSVVHYKHLIVTIPLWVVKRMVQFYVPEGASMQLNVINVTPVVDRYASWDYVYTPYTPANLIHRLSPLGGGYSCEANGAVEQKQLMDDLMYLFPDGYQLDEVVPRLKGHLLPLAQRPAWPANVRPIGRFAKWDPRATTDVSLADALKLTEEWYEQHHAG